MIMVREVALIVIEDGSGAMLRLGTFQGHGEDENFALRRRGGSSLDSAAEEREVIDVDTENDADADAGPIKMNAMDKTRCLAHGLGGGFRSGIPSSYYGEVLSTGFDSNPDFMM